MKQQLAQLNYLKISPRKVRLIANTIRGLSVREAEAQLLLRVQRSAKPLLKLLRSAVANARNNKLDAARLFISDIRVNPGPMLKRILPRAQGRATPIHKKMSHVSVVLQEAEGAFKDRFVINPPVKKTKTKKERVRPKAEETKKVTPKEKGGFFRRLFRRQAV
ncbi:MAG: 50S ribosomal protein L22 [Candidatus Harrisonbacteria bacterium RIFOXYA1_FULL_48_8]|uniref:Large ribosomal subunit protein uL22 n=3 Tax=Parcubacteria group TaxID=1794811 RepID=A0A1G1ZVJ5_9BACT|nr:MAG: 50S ribosomal protein L22 [Candidatus Harrisonbacteria bacterium RIFCSPHIGHO2_12_FULL_48_16]OGY68584.1 MAG: 50S ribosomal protein L22 [Candidatus Harrisonbacteria bacterium RIFOXYA1_FULL_48_8]